MTRNRHHNILPVPPAEGHARRKFTPEQRRAFSRPTSTIASTSFAIRRAWSGKRVDAASSARP
eukprot:7446044-Pyramimonas_sp.AAC.1